MKTPLTIFALLCLCFAGCNSLYDVADEMHTMTRDLGGSLGRSLFALTGENYADYQATSPAPSYGGTPTVSPLTSQVPALLAKANRGDANAQAKLAHHYRNGIGVIKNIPESVKWERKAAQAGFALSQYNLGRSYLNGNGVHQDYRAAMYWFRQAAANGFVKAYSHIGMIYEKGFGLTPNLKEAQKWYRIGAYQGDHLSMAFLASAYQYGHGVPVDPVIAYSWYSLAVFGGDQTAILAARQRDAIARYLTVGQHSQAMKLSQTMLSQIETNQKNR